MKRDPQGRYLFFVLLAVFGGGALLTVLFVPQWDRPPVLAAEITSEELGPSAISMYTLTRTRTPARRNTLTFPLPDPVEEVGVRAGDVYDNVEVLADLDRARFDRLQVAITEWVAPEQGCTYCHAEGPDGEPDYEAEPPYTFEVARGMLRMVRSVNAQTDHVRPQGVTCFTCHRGENVPAYGWYKAEDWPGPEERWYQNPPPWVRTATTIRDFFPREAFELFLLEDNRAAGLQTREVMVPPEDAPDPEGMPLFTRAENTYLLMMQMSDALGENCTFCHNTRAFYDWEQSTPYRTDAYHAILQTRSINHDHIEGLTELFPEDRLGPAGDPFKANCMSCHIGERRPLDGVPMIEHFPGLVGDPGESAPG